MKKGILFLFLLFIPFAYALDISLAGVSFSLTTFFPLIIIASAILFFFFLWIKDNYKVLLEKIVRFPKFGFHKIKREIEKPQIDYLSEVNKFEKKVHNLTIDEALKQFNGIVKDFFSYEFKIEREYTHTELEAILMKHRKETLIPFSNKLAEIKYTNQILTQRELIKLADEFRGIVRVTLGKKIKPTLLEKVALKGGFQYQKPIIEKIQDTIDDITNNFKRTVRSEYFTNKIRFLEDFKLSIRKFIKKFTHATEETGYNFNLYFKHNIANINSRIKENKFRIAMSKLNNLIEEGHKLSVIDTEKARVIYHSALATYYKLPLDEQKRFSQSILNLYNRIEEIEKEREKLEIERLVQKVGDLKKKHHPIPSRFSWLISRLDETLLALLKSKRIKNEEKRRNVLDAIKEIFMHVIEVEDKGIHELAQKERHLVKNIKTISENTKLNIKKEEDRLRKEIKVQVKYVEPSKLRVLKEPRLTEIEPAREEILIPIPTIVKAPQINIMPRIETKIKEKLERPKIKVSKDMRRLIKEEEYLSKKLIALEAS